MFKEGGYNPSEYLQRNLESDKTVPTEELEAYSEILEDYPSNTDQYPVLKESGEERVGNFDYSYSFSEIDPKEFFLDQEFDIKAMMDASPDGPTPKQSKILRYRLLLGGHNESDPDRAKILSSFLIKNNDTDGTIVMDESIPDGYKIIYKPGAEEKIMFDAEGKYIFVDGNILSLKTIVDLLHEIGHARIFESLDSDEKEKVVSYQAKFTDALIEGGAIDDETLARNLEGERAAWAFALKKVKKILDQSEKATNNPTILDFVTNYIHQNILKQNSDTIRRMKNPDFKGLFHEALDEIKREDTISNEK